jgi:hypothetical protein
MNIQVQEKDFGWFSQDAVTVQRFQNYEGERELVWCNHANHQEEQYIDWKGLTRIQIVCDKCNAAYGQDGWEDAPEEGAHK